MDPQLLRAICQAMRAEILERIAGNPSSPRQIAEITGEELNKITYHMAVLRETGCIRPVDPLDTDRADSVYEMVTLLPSPPRLPLSDSTRGQAVAAVLQRLVDNGIVALEAGTFEGSDQTRMTCESVVLDEQGVRDIAEIVDEARKRIALAKSANARRNQKNGRPSTRLTISFAAFETPEEHPAHSR